MSSLAHVCIIFSSYVFRSAMDNSDGSATGRGGRIRHDTYRHLLAFDTRIYTLCSMEHFQISCTLLLVVYNWHFDLHILCICDLKQFVISLRYNFYFFLLTAHALRWGDYLCSFAFFMAPVEFDNPFSNRLPRQWGACSFTLYNSPEYSFVNELSSESYRVFSHYHNAGV